LPTSDKGDNSYSFLILCYFSPLWLCKAPVTGSKISPKISPKSASELVGRPTTGWPLACKPFLENDPRNISSTIFSILTLKVLRGRTAWGVQRGKKWPQTTMPAGWPPLKWPKGHFRGGPPAEHRRVGHNGPR
jgi:hypothetical protein